MKSKNYKNEPNGASRLAAMVAAAREGDRSAALSAECRDRILGAVLREDGADRPLPRLFTPARRLLVAAVLPIVLAGVLLVGFERAVQAPPGTDEGYPKVVVLKRGDRVFFDIRNGKGPHYVCRSTDLGRLDGSCRVPVVDGAYQDGLQDQDDLVFYRIE
jgi:hypothetical protein